MEKGLSFATRMIENSIDIMTREEIDLIVKDLSTCAYEKPDFYDMVNKYSTQVDDDKLQSIRNYTGLESKQINAILRNNWTYEVNGRLTEEKQERYRREISIIDDIIDNFPENTNAFVTYRGTSLDEFKKYQIETIEDLQALKGKYLYEEGYTSTSLDEESSYFNKNIYGSVLNIETRYIIPPASQDGIPLITDNFSYSTNQQEYMLERGSLSKVLDVKIANDSAIITVVLIPKKVWNKSYTTEDENNYHK